MKRLCIAVFLACALVGQVPQSQQTHSEMNGRWWVAVGADARTFFLAGFADGIRSCADTDTQQQFLEGSPTEGAPNIREIQKAVDRFYVNPANAAIPVSDAVFVFIMTERGATPESVAAATTQFRRLAVGRR